MKAKRFLSVFLTATLVSALFTCVGFAEEETEEVTEAVEEVAEEAAEDSTEEDAGDTLELSYPIWDVTGIVPWGDGGFTDTIMRALGIAVEQQLGQAIDVQDMPGNSGATGTEYVYDAPSDGYTILMSAENPPLYEALGISDVSYDDFTCVLLVGDQKTAVVVSADSPYDSLTDLVEASQDGTIVEAGTGTGGLPWTAGGMVSAVTGLEYDIIDYDGDAAAIAAVEEGESDFTIAKTGVALEDYNNGDLKVLCVLADQAVEELPDVAPITDEYPDFGAYLPWGPFCGVFVKNDVDPDIIDTLTGAFAQAYDDDDFQQVLSDNCVNVIGTSGDEAAEYIADWKDNTLNLLKNAGMID